MNSEEPNGKSKEQVDLDIASFLISPESAQLKLASVLPDMFVVDLDFRILIPSKSILDASEYTSEELIGNSFSQLACDPDLVHKLKSALAEGYFGDFAALLRAKGGEQIEVSISGFYLGLISDINGRIVLKVKTIKEVQSFAKLLQEKKDELDNFIYRVSHDLRGPLATIQGLINLVRIRSDDNELERLIQMIDAHAHKLDERLFQLVYLAKADYEDRTPNNLVDFFVLETEMRKIIEQNAFVDFFELHFTSPGTPLYGVNEILLNSLLTNILLYILSLPKAGLDHQVFFRFEVQDMCLKVTIGADGFVIPESSKKAISNLTSIHTDTLNYPKLLNFFAAQKLASKLNSGLHVHFLANEKHRFNLIIPIDTAS